MITDINRAKSVLLVNDLEEIDLLWDITDELLENGYIVATTGHKYGLGRTFRGTKKLDKELMGPRWHHSMSW